MYTPINQVIEPSRHKIISVDKRNQRYIDLWEDYSLEFNMNMSQTFFKILKEYDTYRCLSYARN